MTGRDSVSLALPQFATLTGVYCSGWFTQNPATVTALALLFDKTVFVADMWHMIEVASSSMLDIPEELVSQFVQAFDMHYDKLSEAETKEFIRTFLSYIHEMNNFWDQYRPLMGSVFEALIIDDPAARPADAQRGTEHERSLMTIGEATMDVRTMSVAELLNSGAAPVYRSSFAADKHRAVSDRRAKTLAALLAVKSAQLALPQTKAVAPELMLEARERLKDQLPPYWSAMFRLTKLFKARLVEGAPDADIQAECEDFVDMEVRPALLDLKAKLLQERRTWFYRIITPVANGLNILLTRPPTSPVGLMGFSAMLGQEIGAQLGSAHEEIHSGLTFLIELDDKVRKASPNA